MLAQMNDQQSPETIEPQTVDMSTRARARHPGVLVVDDMGLILTLLKLELEENGCNVWVASDGASAIELYRKRRAEIDIVLLDVQMPGLDGPATLAALQEVNPDLRACFMTGNPGVYTEQDLIERGAAWVFNKPFRTAEVAYLVQVMLRAGRSAADTRGAFVCEWQPIQPITKENVPCAS